MSKCHYHPDARGTASCPTCRQPICDRCRLNGNSLRCGTCQSASQKTGGDASSKPRCANHADIPTEERCVSCRKHHCVACLNTAKRCFKCVQKAQKAEAEAAAAAASPRRGTSSLKRTPTGLLSDQMLEDRPKRASALALGAGAAGLLAGVMLTFVLTHQTTKHRPPYLGPTRVSIISPASGGVFTGSQSIKLDVQAAGDIERVDVSIDGKSWDHLKAPPFQTEWQTSIFRNGKHVIAAKAIYRGEKRVAKAQIVVKTHNRLRKV